MVKINFKEGLRCVTGKSDRWKFYVVKGTNKIEICMILSSNHVLIQKRAIKNSC